MKKKLMLFFIIFLTIPFYFGCENIYKSPDDIKLKDSVLVFRMNENSWNKDSKKAILEITDDEGIELFNNLIDNATKVENYQTISTPNMSFVVGTNEPKEIPVEEEANPTFKNDTNIIDMGDDKQNKGFASYSLLAIFTILVSLVILYVVFK